MSKGFTIDWGKPYPLQRCKRSFLVYITGKKKRKKTPLKHHSQLSLLEEGLESDVCRGGCC